MASVNKKLKKNMNLESPIVTIQKTSHELYEYLSKIKNFEYIMPDNIEKFESNDESFSFLLKGLPEIELKLQEQDAPNKIILESTSEKFPFTLDVDIEDHSDISSNMQFKFAGKFNPMIAMMLKKPIQKFINTLTENMKTK